ncbi:MFS transporter [Actinomycetaceae bacterium L2_0104]
MSPTTNNVPAEETSEVFWSDNQSRGRIATLVGALIFVILSYQFGSTLLAPALPTIATDLGESTEAVARLQSLFFMSGAVLGVALSRWSDYIGRRRSLIIILTVCTVGTVICLFASNLPMLIVGRILQGSSNAAYTICYLVLAERLDKRLFGICLGIVASINGGVGGIDSLIGGVVTDTIGWRFLFVIILVASVLGYIGLLTLVPRDEKTERSGKMDWWGAATMAVFLACLSSFIENASSFGLSDSLTLIYLAGMVVAAFGFVIAELKVPYPLIAVSALRSRRVWPVFMTTLLTLCGTFSFVNYTMVLFTQGTGGYAMSASRSSMLYLTPQSLAGVVAAIFAGYLAQRFGWYLSLRVSAGLTVLLMAAINFFLAEKAIVFVLLIALGAVYMGQLFTTVNGISVINSPKDSPGALPGINGAAFGIGASAGIAVVAPVAAGGTFTDYQNAFWISVGFVFAAFIMTLLLQPAEQESEAAV